MSVYNKEFLKTKIKSHGDEVTDFYEKIVPQANSNHACSAVITLVLRKMRISIRKCFKKKGDTLRKKKLGISTII